MVVLFVISFLMLAGMVGLLFWLRRNRNVSKQFDQFTGTLSGSSRWQSIEVLVGGMFLAATALLRRTDAGTGEFRVVRSDQPGYLLLAIGIYFILVGLLFLIRPAHVSRLLEGLGMIALGLFVLLTAGMVISGGAALVTLYGAGVNDLFTRHPWILIIIALVIGGQGVTSIRYYFRERAAQHAAVNPT